MTKKTRILAVDDEPVIGESIVSMLAAPHRKIEVAANGRDALKTVTKQKVDIVITDHRMPAAGGLELVKKLREHNYKGKIVVLSGHLSPANIGIYEDLEVDEVIGKPLALVDLSQIVQNLEEDIELGL